MVDSDLSSVELYPTYEQLAAGIYVVANPGRTTQHTHTHPHTHTLSVAQVSLELSL